MMGTPGTSPTADPGQPAFPGVPPAAPGGMDAIALRMLAVRRQLLMLLHKLFRPGPKLMEKNHGGNCFQSHQCLIMHHENQKLLHGENGVGCLSSIYLPWILTLETISGLYVQISARVWSQLIFQMWNGNAIISYMDFCHRWFDKGLCWWSSRFRTPIGWRLTGL